MHRRPGAARIETPLDGFPKPSAQAKAACPDRIHQETGGRERQWLPALSVVPAAPIPPEHKGIRVTRGRQRSRFPERIGLPGTLRDKGSPTGCMAKIEERLSIRQVGFKGMCPISPNGIHLGAYPVRRYPSRVRFRQSAGDPTMNPGPSPSPETGSPLSVSVSACPPMNQKACHPPHAGCTGDTSA